MVGSYLITLAHMVVAFLSLHFGFCRVIEIAVGIPVCLIFVRLFRYLPPAIAANARVESHRSTSN